MAPSGATRALFAGERERIQSIPSGTSDLIEKVPKESLHDRATRRSAILSATMPLSILSFATQALLSAYVPTTQAKEFDMPIDVSELRNAWATTPFCCSPEAANYSGRVGPDISEVTCSRFAHVSEALQRRKSAGQSAPKMAVIKGLQPEDRFLDGIHTNSPFG